MPVPTAEEIREFVVRSIELWNQQDRSEFFKLYKAMAPGGFRFEMPVGRGMHEGWGALEKMWDDYGPHVRIEIRQLIVNGHEAAAVMANLPRSGAAAHDTPSIETYHFHEDGSFHARYFAEM
jgi:hypothetical protein